MNYLEFWTNEHRGSDNRWVSDSEPIHVLGRLGVNLDGAESVLEVGPGRMQLANYLESIGKRVVVYDLVTLDDPRYVADLPLETKVDVAIAHLVLQHVPDCDHRKLVEDVLASLVPGGSFYFDACTEDTSRNQALAEEYVKGTSFPFSAWDLVTSKRLIDTGYFFCVARA